MAGVRRQMGQRREVVAVGLTGGIGAGKSTALGLFARLGALTLSADRLVHELYSGPDVAGLIGGHFGNEVLDAHGAVDRSRLAAAVRGRPDQLRWLEALVHPLVAREVERRIEGAPSDTVVVCEVPLLFESEYERLFDLVVTVETGADIRRTRSVHGFDLDQFAELEGLQAPRERRVQCSDVVLTNDGSPEELAAGVGAVYEMAQALLGVRP